VGKAVVVEIYYRLDLFSAVNTAHAKSLQIEGKQLNYIGVKLANRSHIYRSTPKKCQKRPQERRCAAGCHIPKELSQSALSPNEFCQGESFSTATRNT